MDKITVSFILKQVGYVLAWTKEFFALDIITYIAGLFEKAGF